MRIGTVWSHIHTVVVVAVQMLPDSMCTYNMHILVCRLSKQELARGCTGKDGELWVERAIQRSKSNVKYRMTAAPEKLLMHDVMVDAALLDQKQSDRLCAQPVQAVRSFDEWVPEYRVNMRTGPLYDPGDAETGTQLLGKGKPLGGQALQAAEEQLHRLLHRTGEPGWAADLPAPSLHSFSMAFKRGDEILWSKESGRTRTR